MSQRKSARSQSSQAEASQDVSPEEMKELIANVVKFILHRHHENKVTKRSDILTHIVKGRCKRIDALMSKVEKRFDRCLGMKLINLNNQGKLFTLQNKLEELEGSLSLYDSIEEVAKQGVLSLILAYIFLNKKPVREERLHRLLRNLEILENVEMSQTIDEVGNISKVLKEFVEQQYLECFESGDGDDKIKQYKWGVRAEQTISKTDVISFISKIYDCSPNTWTSMFADVKDRFNHDDD